jgi:hypothetical protein
MIDVQILIPVAGNDGIPFERTHFAAFESEITATFGGYTLLPDTVTGGWRNDAGVLFTDESHIYIVAIVSLTDGGRLGELIAFAKTHFAQEKIGIRYLGLFEAL